MESTTLPEIATLVSRLVNLSRSLPNSVQLATQQSKIYRLVTSVNEGDVYETFNRIFDLLFKEDKECRNEEGRLVNICRGKYGMDKLCAYLQGIHWADASMAKSYDLVKIRLLRVINELVEIW